MAQARLMNKPEDYQKLNLGQGPVELWEDAMRDDFASGKVEWWYFDAILDDGSKIAACYSTKIQPFMSQEGLHPCLTYHITTPEGKQLSRKVMRFKKGEVSLSKEKCDVRFGPHIFQGDLREYHIKAAPVKGLGFDVKLTSTTTPWRGETGYLGFEEHDEKYFTWLCVVPSGKVEGTITIDGKERRITGTGYHDHQWGNTVQYEFLNHWFWGRQKAEKHNILVFDFIMNQHYEYIRIPLVFIEDENGKVIFESTDSVKCTVEKEFFQEACQTNFPEVIHYGFEKDGKVVDYVVRVKQELDGRNVYKQIPFFMRSMFQGTRPKYGRYLAEGTLSMTVDGVRQFCETSDFIYEFAYVGESYKEHMETV